MRLFVVLLVIGQALLAKDLVDYISQMDDASGQFLLETIDDGDVLSTSSGSFSLKKPNFLYWQQTLPVERLIVGDGHWLWIDDPALNQTQKRVYDTEMTQIPLLSWLVDSKKLEDQYVIRKEDHHTHLVFYLTHRLGPDDDSIVITISDGNYHIIQSDHIGIDTHLMLTFDQPTRQYEFGFIPPLGRDVIVQQ
tara:strand:+ start:509 stop:1087 length:579 start_codon:yes stop_codon:yes gene_type:complete